MKKILLLIGLICAISCSKDESSSLSVQVNTVKSFEATISWSFEGSDGQTLYKLLLNDNVVEEAFSGNQYTFTNLQDNVTYNGVVFAISQDGDETFQEFSFTTELSLTKDGDFFLDTQQKADNFFYTKITGVLSIKGNLVQDLSNLASLEAVGELRIQDTNLSNLAGLQNLTQWASPDSRKRLVLERNPNLQNINAIHGLPPASLLLMVDSPLITNLGNLTVQADGGGIRIKNCGIESIQSLSNITRIGSIELTNLPNLASLEGFNNLEEAIGNITLASLPLVSNFSGLGSLQSAARMSIFSSGFTSFSGANSLESLTSLSVSNSALINFSGLNNFESVDHIFISSCSELENLSGLENLTSLNTIEIDNCSKLENLVGLTGIQQLDELTIKNSANIQNMMGLDNLVFVDEFVLNNLAGMNNLIGLNNLELANEFSILELPNLVNFEGLNNLSIVRNTFGLNGLDLISNLEGLDNLEKVTRLFIYDCEMLTNLDGSNLLDNYTVNPILSVRSNPNLADLCGLTNFAINGVPFQAFDINNNAYNPTYQQIIDPNLCAQ